MTRILVSFLRPCLSCLPVCTRRQAEAGIQVVLGAMDYSRHYGDINEKPYPTLQKVLTVLGSSVVEFRI